MAESNEVNQAYLNKNHRMIEKSDPVVEFLYV